ncbi:hypothetical protein [Streptomyces chartreusis]
MQLPHIYRVTKYDPADRDEHGHYRGSEDTVSDHGEIEVQDKQARVDGHRTRLPAV